MYIYTHIAQLNAIKPDPYYDASIRGIKRIDFLCIRVRTDQEEFNSRTFKVIYKEIQGLKAEKKALEISKK
jgi:hypothetical protein